MKKVMAVVAVWQRQLLHQPTQVTMKKN